QHIKRRIIHKAFFVDVPASPYGPERTPLVILNKAERCIATKRSRKTITTVVIVVHVTEVREQPLTDIKRTNRRDIRLVVFQSNHTKIIDRSSSDKGSTSTDQTWIQTALG